MSESNVDGDWTYRATELGLELNRPMMFHAEASAGSRRFGEDAPCPYRLAELGLYLDVVIRDGRAVERIVSLNRCACGEIVSFARDLLRDEAGQVVALSRVPELLNSYAPASNPFADRRRPFVPSLLDPFGGNGQ